MRFAAEFVVSFLLLAHLWYPEECCENKHCYPVEWVKNTYDGTIVKTTDGVEITVPRDIPRKASEDGKYHLCFQKESLRLYRSLEIYCFFVPGEA